MNSKIKDAKIFIILILILILITGTVADAVVFKETKLGNFTDDHRYYVHLYNIDDSESLTVNGEPIATVSIHHDQLVDITNYLKIGNNIIGLEAENTQYIWEYGFDLMQDSSIIWSDSCGSPGNGCENGDQTLGVVYRNTITFGLNYIIPAEIPITIKQTVTTQAEIPQKTPSFEFIMVIVSTMVIYYLRKRQIK